MSNTVVINEKTHQHPSMLWHGVEVVLLFILAVASIIEGAYYIGEMYYDTFQIKPIMDSLSAEAPSVFSAFKVLTIIYSLASVFVGMEYFLAFNSMRITEKGGSFYAQKVILHGVVVNAAFVVIGILLIGFSRIGANPQVAYSFLIPGILAVINLALYVSNRSYYPSRNDEFIH